MRRGITKAGFRTNRGLARSMLWMRHSVDLPCGRPDYITFSMAILHFLSLAEFRHTRKSYYNTQTRLKQAITRACL